MSHIAQDAVGLVSFMPMACNGASTNFAHIEGFKASLRLSLSRPKHGIHSETQQGNASAPTLHCAILLCPQAPRTRDANHQAAVLRAPPPQTRNADQLSRIEISDNLVSRWSLIPQACAIALIMASNVVEKQSCLPRLALLRGSRRLPCVTTTSYVIQT